MGKKIVVLDTKSHGGLESLVGVRNKFKAKIAVKNETKNTKPLTTARLVVLWSSMPGVSSGVKFSETFFPLLPKENS